MACRSEPDGEVLRLHRTSNGLFEEAHALEISRARAGCPLRKPERYDILDGYVKAYKTDPGVVGREEVVGLALMTVVPNSEAM